MKTKKKSLFSILILVFSHVPNTLAEGKKNESIPSSTVNPIGEVKLISDDFIQIHPTASTIEMSKPIAQSKGNNMVKHRKYCTYITLSQIFHLESSLINPSCS
jgi:hypothetical protein